MGSDRIPGWYSRKIQPISHSFHSPEFRGIGIGIWNADFYQEFFLLKIPSGVNISARTIETEEKPVFNPVLDQDSKDGFQIQHFVLTFLSLLEQYMRIHSTRLLMTALTLVFLTLFSVQATIAGELVKVTGTISADLQLVADNGETYEIAENEMGDALVELVGIPVEVEGRLEDQEGVLVFSVINFRKL